MRVVMTSPYSLSRPGGVQGQVLGLARECSNLQLVALALCDVTREAAGVNEPVAIP